MLDWKRTNGGFEHRSLGTYARILRAETADGVAWIFDASVYNGSGAIGGYAWTLKRAKQACFEFVTDSLIRRSRKAVIDAETRWPKGASDERG